ncbi:MAG: TetR/AcrR family transcriptional regulator [Planctomycetota bacterium]|nr:MAG: TetR/AcrR family transcriptional regulator [Planctomycetota bacterium]
MELNTQRKGTSKRRRDILDASLRCFMKHGIEAATIEQIREASGASSGSIYHHFGSKQAIAVALYLDGMEELAVVLRNAMQEQDDLRQGIRDVIAAYLDWVSQHRDWALYLLRVATADLTRDDASTIDEINRRSREDLARWLRPFVDRGEIEQLPDELYASLIYGAATHFVRHWLVGRLTLDVDFVVETLAHAARCSISKSTHPDRSATHKSRNGKAKGLKSKANPLRSRKGASK